MSSQQTALQTAALIANFGSPLSLGIISGLFLEKPLGITLWLYLF